MINKCSLVKKNSEINVIRKNKNRLSILSKNAKKFLTTVLTYKWENMIWIINEKVVAVNMRNGSSIWPGDIETFWAEKIIQEKCHVRGINSCGDML